MSRGPLPSRGLKAAMPVALARGHVECIRRKRGSTANLIISGNGILAIIRIQLAQRLHTAIPQIEWEFADTIARLRIHPGGGPVSRELWLYSRHGALRFFRVEDTGMTELGADGKIPEACPALPAVTAGALPPAGVIPGAGSRLLPDGVPGGVGNPGP